MVGALWPGPLSRLLALLHVHFELREACLDRGGQSAAGAGVGGWFLEGGSSEEGKLFLCGGEWLVQGLPLSHSGDPRFCLFPPPDCPGLTGSPTRYCGRALVF